MAVRTTVTLDDDVAKLLERVAAERGVRPKEVLNEVLRTGLRAARTRRPGSAYRMTPVDLGRCLIGDVADVAAALAAAEGDRFR
jgi:hypothetical protein